jgi:nitrate reductase assembly molybdenum cofactor insertion protein NarJ
MDRQPETLRLLSELLSYPGPRLAGAAAECASALEPAHPAAAERLRRFAGFAAGGLAEEAYTGAFDLAPVTSPYMGDQLFGESRERALLMAWLRELQRDAGLERTTELPDHAAEVLRLLAAPLPDDVRDDVASEGLGPSARKMLAALEEARHPYADVVAAVVEVVGGPAAEPVLAAPARPRSGLEVIP